MVSKTLVHGSRSTDHTFILLDNLLQLILTMESWQVKYFALNGADKRERKWRLA